MKTLQFFMLFLVLSISTGFGTTHTIVSSGFTFSPNTLTINLGDTVNFVLTTIHNAAEVSQATWNANGTTSNGGFLVPFGGGKLVLTTPGTHWYVCQVHGPMGMKGIITVTAPPPPNTITVRNLIDQDGNLVSTGDQVFKKWGLKLYQDSVGSGIVLDSVSSGDSLTMNNLSTGTYVAVEADSLFWSHISVTVDGISQGGISTPQWPITVTTGETHVIDFINFTSNTIINSGSVFIPDSMTVLAGERIQFVLEPAHNAREVSQASWLINDTASNGGFQIPSGGGDVVLFDSGTHYYISTPDAVAGMKGKIIVVPDSTVIAVGSTLIAGWNIISLPVRVSDNNSPSIYPTSISRAFAYQGSYVPLTTLTDGYGYWLKFNDSQTVVVHGFSLVRDSLSVQKGWNIIGSISNPLAAAGLSSQPPGIIVSPLYGFNGSYFTADTIVPGYGYWLKVDQSGELFLAAPTATTVPRAMKQDPVFRNTGTLVVRDDKGTEKTLYLVDGDAETPGMRLIAELPPVPPAGAFDVRFASGHQLKSLGKTGKEEFPVQISSASYPVTLTWNMESLHRSVALRVDGVETELNHIGSIKIANPIQSIALETISSALRPTDYSLSHAFPNPFNPSTIIRYTLPVRSTVMLKVFNIIGQEIGTLVDAIQDEGSKSVQWNAGDVSSGMYFVELNAVSTGTPDRSFHHVIKVVLQK